MTNRAGKPKGFGYIEYEQEVSETAGSLSPPLFSPQCVSLSDPQVLLGVKSFKLCKLLYRAGSVCGNIAYERSCVLPLIRRN